MRPTVKVSASESGFTLIEVMITMVIAMVIMAGLLQAFITQQSEYNYLGKRTNKVLDLEFGMSFISADIRSALISTNGTPTANPTENSNFSGADKTQSFTFWAWDETNGVTSGRAQRKYVFSGTTLRYDNEASGTDDTTNAITIILKDVTYFKVFEDGVTPRSGYAGIPLALNSIDINDESGNPHTINGYTVLIELAVNAGYKSGSFKDVKDVDVRTTTDKRKRVWRYIQIYPMSVVN